VLFEERRLSGEELVFVGCEPYASLVKTMKQRHMVHGISRSASWVFTFSLKMALKVFVIPARYNCVYSRRDVLRSLTYLSLEAEYAEGGLEILRGGYAVTTSLERFLTPTRSFTA